MNSAINTFVLVFASIFPIVNPPGSALVFLGLTSGATPEIRAVLARRIAINSFTLLVCSFLLGALILQFYRDFDPDPSRRRRPRCRRVRMETSQ